jgi:hypothetical protein
MIWKKWWFSILTWNHVADFTGWGSLPTAACSLGFVQRIDLLDIFVVLEAACVAWLQVCVKGQHVSSRYELCQLVGVKANCDLYAVEGAWDCTNWLWLAWITWRHCRNALHYKLAIPLWNGLRARVDVDCPSTSSWNAFVKSMEPVGILPATTADDIANAHAVPWRGWSTSVGKISVWFWSQRKGGMDMTRRLLHCKLD